MSDSQTSDLSSAIFIPEQRNWKTETASNVFAAYHTSHKSPRKNPKVNYSFPQWYVLLS